MKFEGGCYCRKIRYVAEGEPRLKAQCHCRECQYISGGAPNMFMLVEPLGSLHERRTAQILAFRSRKPRDARILWRMRDPSGNATTRAAADYPESRHA